MNTKDERLGEILRDLAARFLLVNGNNSSLLTVTHVNLTDKGKYATILFTVFPDTFEKTALEFAKRKRSEFREFINANRLDISDKSKSIGLRLIRKVANAYKGLGHAERKVLLDIEDLLSVSRESKSEGA